MQYYKDKSTGRQHKYTPIKGKFVIRRVASGQQERPSTSASSATASNGASEEIVVRRFSASESTLRTRFGIKAVINAFEDEDGQEVLLVPDEVAVQFKSDIPKRRILEILGTLGFHVSRDYIDSGLFTVNVPAESDIFRMIQVLNRYREVEISGPLHWGRDHREAYSEQLIQNTRAFKRVEVCSAWEVAGQGHPSVRVAVIDAGVDVDHPMLRDNIPLIPDGDDWDFTSEGLNPNEDDFAHGTKVAGIAVGRDPIGRCLGVTPGCGLIPLKVGLIEADVLQRADALRYLARRGPELGVRVVNCSWHVDTDDPFIRTAIRLVTDAGMLVVCSAGNMGFDFPHFPSDYEFVLSVAALKRDGAKWPRSNYGSGINLCAPGTRIGTAVPGGLFAHGTGTSYAASIVTGCAALVWSRFPDLKADEVRERILSTTTSIDEQNPAYAGELGCGCVNVLKAVQ